MGFLCREQLKDAAVELQAYKQFDNVNRKAVEDLVEGVFFSSENT